MYFFYENIFQDKSIHMVFKFPNSTIIYDLYSQYLTETLSKMTFL